MHHVPYLELTNSPKSTNTTGNPPTPNTQTTTSIQSNAAEVFQLSEPSKVDDIPALSYKAIATIINKATQKFADIIRKKEGFLLKKGPNRYNQNPKTVAGNQLKAKDQPNLATIRDPSTTEVIAEPIPSTSSNHTSKKNTPATHRSTSPSPLGKTHLTKTHAPTPKLTNYIQPGTP